MNETSGASSEIKDLITIVLVYTGSDPKGFISGLVSDIEMKYTDVPVLVGITGRIAAAEVLMDLKSGRENVKIVRSSGTSESRMWTDLIGKVETDFVLVGRDIHRIYPKV